MSQWFWFKMGVPWPYLSRPASSSDSVLALGCGALRSLFSFVNSVGFCLAPFGPQLGNVEDARSKRNPCMLCFLPYKSTLLKRGRGDASIFATILRMSPQRNFVPLFHWSAEQIAPLFEHMQPAGVGYWQFHILHLPMKGCLQRTLPPKDAIK